MQSWLLQVLIWVKLGWPIAVEIYEVLKDGKVTREEVIDAIDRLLQGKDTITVWKKKEIK